MSIESYRANVRKRVAGKFLPICFPASIEQVSPNHGYRANIYRYQKDWVDSYWELPRKQRESREVIEEVEAANMDRLLRPMGLDGWEDALYSRATTPTGFARTAGRLLMQGYRVVADLTYSGPAINGAHAVGLIPTGEHSYVHLVSNHVHKRLQGVVNLKRVGEHVAVYSGSHFDDLPFHDCNIMALPPVE